MKKWKVMTIFSTRPEAIKMARLVLELQKQQDMESIAAVSSQHRQMLDQVLTTLNKNRCLSPEQLRLFTTTL